MNRENYRVGNVVTLNSGGPRMTIESKEEEGIVCVWFGSGNELRRGIFADGMLE